MIVQSNTNTTNIVFCILQMMFRMFSVFHLKSIFHGQTSINEQDRLGDDKWQSFIEALDTSHGTYKSITSNFRFYWHSCICKHDKDDTFWQLIHIIPETQRLVSTWDPQKGLTLADLCRGHFIRNEAFQSIKAHTNTSLLRKTVQ